jgi:hypothetical protein
MSITFIQSFFSSIKMKSFTENKQLLTGLAVALGAFPLLSYSISCYRGWLELGQGGLPRNVAGWLVNVAMHLVARLDTRTPVPYTLEGTKALWGSAGNASYFDDKLPPPPRAGERPDVPSYVAPQRQTTEQGSQDMVDTIKSYMAALATQNPDIFQLKPSGLEGPSQDALWLADGVSMPAYLKATKGEVMHPHGEGSIHAVLSLPDSAKAIELGWAEFHKLSGRVVPLGYVLIYAPRNDQELKVWKKFVIASARFNAVAAGGPALHEPSV